jgi:hypothetical protein
LAAIGTFHLVPRRSTPDHARESDVILEILAHTWQMLYQRNSEPVQLSFVADSRLHQHLGGD